MTMPHVFAEGEILTADELNGNFADLDARAPAAPGQPAPAGGALFGTYTAGRRTRVCGGLATLTTTTASVGTLNLPSDFAAGLLAVSIMSTADPNRQFRVVSGSSTGPNNVQIVARTAAGAGAGAISEAVVVLALGWD